MRRIVTWLHARLTSAGAGERTGRERWEAGRDDDESEDGEAGFLMSRLDASVLLAHGFGSTAAERELKNVQRKAELLAEARRDR